MLLVALTGVVGAAASASAHATLLLTDPVNGAALDRMPAAVTLTFSQPQLTEGAAVQVSGPKGVVSEGEPRFVDRAVEQAIKPGAPEGTYVVAWRTTSVDGHVISGQFGFTVGTPTGAIPAATTAVDTGGLPMIVWVLIGVAVVVVVAGTMLAVGRPPTRADDEEPLTSRDTEEDTVGDRQDSPPR